MKDKSKFYRYCGKCGSEMDESLICPNCGKNHNVEDKGDENKPFQYIKLAIIAITVLCLIMAAGFAGWLEKAIAPVRGWFGDGLAISVAYESENYFRKSGTQTDFQYSDMEAIADKAKEINEYKIKITETIADKKNLNAFFVRQNIVFERSEDMIKVQVSPDKTQQGNRASFYEKLFEEYRLLPFGLYYIITENGETCILMNSGQGDGNYMKKKSTVKASENKALYEKILSYGMDKIIDYKAFKGNNVSCYEAAGVREYSTPGERDYWTDVYLREYQSKPGGYLMKYDIPKEDIRREIKADFYYSGIDKKLPKINEFK